MNSNNLHYKAYSFAFLLIFVFSIQNSYANCNANSIPISAGTNRVILPETGQGEWYEHTIHFRFLEKLNGSLADSFNLTLSGLPEGLTYECDQPGCVYDASKTFGCVTIKGNIRSRQGDFSIIARLNSYVNFFNRVVSETIENKLTLIVNGKEKTETNDLTFKLLPNHPNPFTSFTEIRFITPHNEVVEFSVFDLLGNKVYVTNIKAVSGTNNYTYVPANHIQAGSYFYTIKSREGSLTRRMHISYE